jgi:hypothetical protein
METADRLDAQRVLLRRDFWVLIGGQNASVVGDNLLLIVLPLFVLDLTGSPLQVSIVFILTQLPTFLGFLWGAARRLLPPRSLLVIYQTARLVLLLAVAALFTVGRPPIVVVYALFFLINCFTILFRPTKIELVTHVVPQASLLRFNSYDRTVEAVAAAAGLGFGGYAYQYLQLPVVFLVAAGTCLVAAVSLLFLGATPRAAPGVARQRARTWETIVAVVRRPVTAFLLSGETLAGAAFGIFVTMFVVYARRYLHVDGATFGRFELTQALSATAAGICIGAGLIRLSQPLLAVLGYLGMGLSMVLMGLNALVWPVFPLMVTLGMTNMMYVVAVRTLLQTSSGPGELIHVFALESMLSRAAQIIGAATAGVVLSLGVVGVSWTLLAAGLMMLIVAGWGRAVLFSSA